MIKRKIDRYLADFFDTDRKNFLGLVGALSDNEIKRLLYEVLTPIGYNLMVTPKEVDFLTDKIK